jgi:hypothetical protein
MCYIISSSRLDFSKIASDRYERRVACNWPGSLETCVWCACVCLHVFVSLWHGDDLSDLDLRLGTRLIVTA